MISLDYIYALVEHIKDVIQTELVTVNLLEIFTLGVFEFVIFYYISNFAKKLFFKIFILVIAFTTLWQILHGDRILTEPALFGIFGLVSPHLDIFSKLTRYMQKVFLALKTLFLILIDYIITPIEWFKLFSNKINSFSTKKPNSKQEDFKQEKTYKDYFHENKEEEREYERQKSDYYQNKQQDKQRKQQQEQEKRRQEQQKKREQDKQKEYEKQKEQQRRKRQKSDEQKKQKQKQKQENQQKSNSDKKDSSRWDSTDPYEVLGVSKNATQKEIKKAFINLAKIYHPDATQDKEQEYKIIFQKINNAYQKLKS